MIAIIKYNAGNIRSVQNALLRLGYQSLVTDDHETIYKADKVILPGVGEAGSAMKQLKNSGLDKLIPTLKQPFLGICLGLQLMCSSSEEGHTPCLDIFNTSVRKFPPGGLIPHMGWNDFTTVSGKLFNNVSAAKDVYFVHSYYAEISKDTSAVCEYILPFAAAFEKENFFATQFHPEKSAKAGEQILRNFLQL